jgi:hypothetical protein
MLLVVLLVYGAASVKLLLPFSGHDTKLLQLEALC